MPIGPAVSGALAIIRVIVWLAAFGLLGAPTAPVGGIVPTVGGQAHALTYSPSWVQCGRGDEADVTPWEAILADLWGEGVLKLFGILGYEADWICMH